MFSSSGSSNGTSVELAGALSGGSLHITGYHFRTVTTMSLALGDNVNYVFGYRYLLCSPAYPFTATSGDNSLKRNIHRLSDKTAVVAKVSVASLQLEREFYIIKRLYQTNDGSHYLGKEVIDE